jgi:hypothetical protein
METAYERRPGKPSNEERMKEGSSRGSRSPQKEVIDVRRRKHRSDFVVIGR